MTNTRHLRVIDWIDRHQKGGLVIMSPTVQSEQFSLATLLEACPGRRATLYNIMNRLKFLGYVDRTAKAWQHTHWYATKKWKSSGVQRVKEDYELYMLVRVSAPKEFK